MSAPALANAPRGKAPAQGHKEPAGGLRPCAGSSPFSDFMLLQRGAGNRAVSALLTGILSRSDSSGEKIFAGQPSLQRGNGRSLDASVRGFMERGFGHNFSEVCIHTDAQAANSARALHAQAYTIGNDVFFGTGRYSPQTMTGKVLLAHELAHVVQQRNAVPSSAPAIAPLGASLEMQAARASKNVATGGFAGSVGQAGSQCIQCADENESLGVLDSSTVDALAGKTMGQGAWHFLRELMRGFVGGTREEMRQGAGEKIKARFKELLWSPRQLFQLGEGYYWGLIQGLVSPLTDLWELVKFGAHAISDVIGWVYSKGKALFKNAGNLLPTAQSLITAFGSVMEEAGSTIGKFIHNPREGIKELKLIMDQLMAAAMDKARSAGHAAAEAIFKVIDLPWFEFGERVGHVVGEVVVQVLMLVFSEGIGNAISTVGRSVAGMGRWAAAEAMNALRMVGELAAKLMEMFKSLGKTVFKFFGELAAKVGQLLERANGFLKEAAQAIEPTPLLVEGAEAPPGTFLSKGIKAEEEIPQGARKISTTTEQLRPQQRPTAGQPRALEGEAKKPTPRKTDKGSSGRTTAPKPRSFAEAARAKFENLRGGYAERLNVGPGGEVHHARELTILDKYPGVYSEEELNAFRNMRGVPAKHKAVLHQGTLRAEWNSVYNKLDSLIIDKELRIGTSEYNSTVREIIERAVLGLDERYDPFMTHYGLVLK